MASKEKPGEAKKPEKPGKVSRQFLEPMPRQNLEKNFLKFLEQSGDRQFFESCFAIQGEDAVLREGLGRKDAKKFKALLKAIKANRKGPLKLIPLAVAAALIAALVFFFTVMLNPLLERAMETGLEMIFEARSDVDNFKLNLLGFSVGIDQVTVANRDEPMRNLFQIGRMRFRLRPQAVLQGKIYIEEIRADSILFGTDRTVSGALPDRPGKVKPPKPSKPETPPLVDLKNFDAMGLLNREFDKLQTPKLYDQAIEVYDQSLAKWKGQVDLVKTRSAELQASAQPLLRLNFNNLDPRDPRSIETITNAVRDITAMVNNVQTAADEAQNLVGGLQQDIDNATGLARSAQSSVEADFAHLKSYINFGSGTAFDALEPSIREILSNTAEQYFDYGLRALEIFEKFKAENQASSSGSEPKPKKENKPAFKGRDVIYPSVKYPKFYLGVLASDFTLAGWKYGFDLEGVSSDPDLYPNKPITLSLSFDETAAAGRQVGFEGALDLRSKRTERFTAEVNGSGFPVSLEQEFAQVGIGGFSGNTAFSLGLNGKVNGDVSGDGRVSLVQARLLNPTGTLAEAVDTAVREAGEVRLGIEYAHLVEGNDRFSLNTNIGDLIRQALEQAIRAYADQASRELERVLRERIASYIDGRLVSQKELDLLFAAAKGDRSALEGVKNTLENKKNEFEQRLKGAAEEAVNQAKQEVQRQGEQAIQDLMQGNTPTAPSLPNIPGGFRLPGR
jgi:uncharacterized protein (TIGR03545 family)